MVKTIQFNYQGIDSEEKQQIALKNLISIEESLRNTYMERVYTFSKDSFEKNPEPFRFANKENCSVILFILPYEYDELMAAKFFFLSTPSKRKEEVAVLSYNELSDLNNYRHQYHFFHQKILPLFGYDKTQIILDDDVPYREIKSTNSLFHKEMIGPASSIILKDRIRKSIAEDINNFQNNNQTKLSYFAKDAYKFPFSILDLKPLVHLVNDEDFTYQLDQAMAAYHQNLFLPCAATLGVVLETLCIIILKDNGVNKIKSGDTQLGNLKERLVNERIITRRDNTRLEVAYKMRNMASHSSPGVALKEDCHFMLNVINTLAFEYLNKN